MTCVPAVLAGYESPAKDALVAAETTLVSGLAGRYATALFELARDNGSLDAVLADLERIDAAIAGEPAFAAVLRSPMFTRDEQEKGVGAVLERLGAGNLVRPFVGLVARNRRLFALHDMIRGFRKLLAAHRNETLAEVVSAVPLNDAQVQSLRNALAQATSGTIRLDTKVDPSLIGGLVVKLGSRMVDASIRTKLNDLKIAMKGVG
jgi:F-type H+-transporting ATPase subunit delta